MGTASQFHTYTCKDRAVTDQGWRKRERGNDRQRQSESERMTGTAVACGIYDSSVNSL